MPALTDPAPARHALPRGLCLSLLAPGGHGRVAGTMRAVPVIIPVRFTLVDDDVVFDPGTGEGLSRAVGGSVVAFETDRAGPDGRPLWGVHVTGVATAVGGPQMPGGFRLSSRLMSGWEVGGSHERAPSAAGPSS